MKFLWAKDFLCQRPVFCEETIRGNKETRENCRLRINSHNLSNDIYCLLCGISRNLLYFSILIQYYCLETVGNILLFI